MLLGSLAEPPYLIYEGTDADGAPLEEIQTGLVVLVVDKRPLQALKCIFLLGRGAVGESSTTALRKEQKYIKTLSYVVITYQLIRQEQRCLVMTGLGARKRQRIQKDDLPCPTPHLLGLEVVSHKVLL